MTPHRPPSPADTFAEWVQQHVHIEKEPSTLADRLDVLHRLIELTRFEHNIEPGSLSLTDAAWLGLYEDQKGLNAERGRIPVKGNGALKPHSLQVPLLLFLLLGEARRAIANASRQHNRPSPPIAIIQHFKKALRSALRVEDVETTASGKQRFYTNTHFAAARLREQGLLRFTKDEAFKYWALTPLGTLAALDLYQRDLFRHRDLAAAIGHHEMPGWYDLDARIADLLKELTDRQVFAEAIGRAAYVVQGDGSWIEQHADDAMEAFKALLRFPTAFDREQETRKEEQRKQAKGLTSAFNAIGSLTELLDGITLDDEQKGRLDEFRKELPRTEAHADPE